MAYSQQPLGKIIALQYGKPLPQEDRTSDGVPAYGANGILCYSTKAYRTEPSIIVGRKGSAGEVTLTKGPFWPTDVTYYVEHDRNQTNLKFLYYLLKFQNLPRLAKGVKPGINRNDVYTLSVPVPPIPEQKRIVAILDEAFEGIDKAIANTEKNLANARELFENSLNPIFADPADHWTSTTLGKIADFKNGLNFTRSSKGETIKIVGVADFKDNLKVPTSNLSSVQIEGTLSDAYLLREGDIITVRSNGNKQLIGRCLLAGPVGERTSHSGFTIRIRLTSPDIFPLFLLKHLRSGVTRKLLIDSGGGANISSLNQQALTSLPIAFPGLDEQSEIVEKIAAITERISELETVTEQKFEALNELRYTLLTQAFSGKLGLPELLTEAAE